MARPNLKIVPDTGFYLAAILKDGYARSYMLGKGTKFLGYELISSEAILLEVQNKLEEKFGFDRRQAVQVILDIRKVAKIVHPVVKVMVARDSGDDKIVECALEAQADIIVSFDQDLLVLKEYQGIKMVHPSMLQYLFR